jgi:hypothetical protein
VRTRNGRTAFHIDRKQRRTCSRDFFATPATTDFDSPRGIDLDGGRLIE